MYVRSNLTSVNMSEGVCMVRSNQISVNMSGVGVGLLYWERNWGGGRSHVICDITAAVIWYPPLLWTEGQTDRQTRLKHYLPTTLLAGGNYRISLGT